MPTLIIDGAAIATVDSAGTEYRSGHIVVSDGLITAVGAGAAHHDQLDGLGHADIEDLAAEATRAAKSLRVRTDS